MKIVIYLIYKLRFKYSTQFLSDGIQQSMKKGSVPSWSCGVFLGMQGYYNIRDLINIIKHIKNFKLYDLCISRYKACDTIQHPFI